VTPSDETARREKANAPSPKAGGVRFIAPEGSRDQGATKMIAGLHAVTADSLPVFNRQLTP
jgi:hypothetical protein